MNAQTFVMPRDTRDAPMTEIRAHLPRRAGAGWSTAKRVEDILLATLALIVFLLPMLLIALAIRLDSRGPILFRQTRTGRHERSFAMLKFRTMRHELQDLEAAQQTTRDDQRVTRLGALLRRTSLDELPQLFNVLRGDMALVGPRPHAPGTRAAGRLFHEVVPHYAARHRVRPGLTGLAQVRGLRGETDNEEKLERRVESDLEYIERWSVGLDLLIVLRTAIAVLRMKNAY
jgi:exopolysaccharide biosynthesis polyprenyl glycosylphosphotransferase